MPRTAIPWDSFISDLGEGFHTAFRKATDDFRARRIHELIEALPDEDWGEVLEFVAAGLALHYPGLLKDGPLDTAETNGQGK